MGVEIYYRRGCLLEDSFVLSLTPYFTLHTNVIILSSGLYFIMIASKTRNYSLKTLYQPKTDRKEEEQIPTKARLGKLLPTIAQNRQLQRMQAKELGINIKKFQSIISQPKSSEVNNEQIIRAAYFVVKSFGEVDNNFREVFIDLHAKLKDNLFMNQREISLKYKLKEGISYRRTCKVIDKMNNDWIQKKNAAISSLEEQINLKQQESKNQIQRLNVECFKLNEQVAKYKKMANIQYVRSLQRKVEDLKETVSSQQEDYKILAKKNQESSLQIQQLRKLVSEMQVNCGMLEEKVYDLSVVRQRAQLYLLKTKDRFDELKNRMGSLKDIIAKVEGQNENLVAERMKLVNRAAVSFQDLTPRPKYSDYFLFDVQAHLNPTNQIFKGLIESHEGPKNQIFIKYFLANKSKKLMECEAIRQKTANEILEAKSQINKIL